MADKYATVLADIFFIDIIMQSSFRPSSPQEERILHLRSEIKDTIEININISAFVFWYTPVFKR